MQSNNPQTSRVKKSVPVMRSGCKHIWYPATMVDVRTGEVVATWRVRCNTHVSIRNGVKRFAPGTWLPIGQALWTRIDPQTWIYYRKGCDSSLHNGTPLYKITIGTEPLN